ncbi:hypothetical protein IFM89_003627 [Coptis chinensis]|uniref:Reverse transcriptase domain-containing protein n=1 Tax=Coptis chinensis TaxID=261450 RepID=A0A835H322_9MAGN|nr:hypothetical protein IFM89_003627 [Coptis chinensis]
MADNIAIAQERIHSMKKRKKASKGRMAIQFDMAKAYDKVEWSFLTKVMKALGFCDGFVKFILEFLASTSFSLLLNGSLWLSLKPQEALDKALPLFVPHMCINFFETGGGAKSHSWHKVNRVSDKVQSWKTRVLSQAGRTTLVKSVGMATPIYIMSSLILPTTTCKMDQILCSFWWRGSNERSSMNLKSLASLCKPEALAFVKIVVCISIMHQTAYLDLKRMGGFGGNVYKPIKKSNGGVVGWCPLRIHWVKVHFDQQLVLSMARVVSPSLSEEEDGGLIAARAKPFLVGSSEEPELKAAEVLCGPRELTFTWRMSCLKGMRRV